MKSIIFDRLPIDIYARHDAKRSDSGINGGYVFYYGVVQALLKYSSYECFMFLGRHERRPFSFADSEEFKNSQRQVRVVHPSEISALPDLDEAVLVTSTERLGPLLRLRQMFEPQRLPVAGFLSAAYPKWFGPFLMEMLLAGVTSYDALACPSQASKAVLESLMMLLQSHLSPLEKYPVQTPLIPEAVDCDEFKGRSDDCRKTFGFEEGEVVILFFGRFEMAGKGDLGPLLITFFRLRLESRRRIRLVLAGADRNKLSGQLAQFATELGCGEGVAVYPDPTNDDKLRLFSAADIFVSPADGVPESFGLAPIEAMASGLPCVISDWDGYRETVTHGETGFLVPTSWSDLGSCVDAFESCEITSESTLAATTVLDLAALEHYLGLLIDSADLRRKMGANARKQAVANFSWPVVVRQYDALFDLQRSQARESGFLSATRAEVRQLSSTQSLFTHYPTELIQLDDAVFLTQAGQEWMRSPFTLGVALARHELLSDKLCCEIAEQLRMTESVPLGTLVSQASKSTGAPAWLTRINAMRLLKYGILGWRRSQASVFGEHEQVGVPITAT